MKRAAALLLGLFMAAPSLAQEAAPQLDLGLLEGARVEQPSGAPTGVAVVISGQGGWGPVEQAAADELTAGGIITLAVDLPTYAQRLKADDGDCLYLVSDIEGASYQLQRRAGLGTYTSPVVAGFGAGGDLALSIAQQTPAATIGAVVAVDPQPEGDLGKPLCGLDSDPPETGVSPIRALFTTAATPEGRTLVSAIVARGIPIESTETADTPAHALAKSVLDGLRTPEGGGDRLSSLPLVELPAKQPSGTMAVVLSGDGGWRDLDKTLAEAFQERGVSTIGLDSLRYFWSEKTPADVADDLNRIITHYAGQWNADRVLLVGYSFGADVLPQVFNLLPAETKRRVRQISLLGFGGQASYEISVSGWLGAATTGNDALPQLRKIDPSLVQCIYGRDEEESACPKLKGTGADLIETEGGHHFDGDYAALAARVLDRASTP